MLINNVNVINTQIKYWKKKTSINKTEINPPEVTLLKKSKNKMEKE